MPSRTRLRRHPNEDWPGIIDRLLGSGGLAEAAREIMWVEVQQYVVSVARLPIGPLNEDEEVRGDVAVGVLHRLERNDHRHLRTWRQRQHEQQGHTPWWNYIQMMAASLAIDAARGSRQNVARRGEPFRWMRTVPVDPHLLGERLGHSPGFLRQASHGALLDYLGEVQEAWRDDEPPADPPRSEPRGLDSPPPRLDSPAARTGFRTKRRTPDR
jgi:hypothetical protein